MRNGHRIHRGKKRSALGRSLFITIVYALVGYTWIIGSEIILSSVHAETPEVFLISISKGLGFVTATSILIFLLIYRNISRLIAESKIRYQSETALQEAQRIAHVGSFFYSFSDNQLKLSDEALQILELQENPDPFAYEELLRHVQIDDRERVRTTLSDALKNECSASFLCRVLRANEPERTVQIRVHTIKNEKEQNLQLIGTLQDLTERVQAEVAARENEAIYHALINSS